MPTTPNTPEHPGDDPDLIRLVPELRAAHIERHRVGTPATLLYFTEKYDLAGTELIGGIRRVDLRSALGHFLRSDASVLELPEPFWMRFLPTHAVLAAGFRLTGALRGRRRRIHSYAMENNDLHTLVWGSSGGPRALTALMRWCLGAYTRLTIDRICFASSASAERYLALPFVAEIPHHTIDELPAALPASHHASGGPDTTAVFVGILEPRKGVEQLLTAWECLERRDPAAKLRIIGPGPLAERVGAWAASAPDTREYLGRLDHSAVAGVLEASDVLVAPSLPEGRWREQIGLPIKEALAHGLTVVTSAQTGLAPWLARHGHEVVLLSSAGTPHDRGLLTRAMGRALSAPLDRDDVRRSLPTQDGRLTADAWLHRPEH